MPMTILMISYRFPPTHSGAGKQAQQLAEALAAQRRRVTVVTASHENRKPTTSHVNGVDIVHIPVPNSASRLRPLVFSLGVLIYILYHRRNITIVHTHGLFWYHFGPLKLAKWFGKRIVIKLTSLGRDDLVTIRNRFWGDALYSVARHSDAVVALNKPLLATSIAAGMPADKCVLIPNGVNNERFFPVADGRKQELRHIHGFPAQRAIVLTVGAIVEEKGMDTLIEAWHVVLQSVPAAMLLMIGPIDKDVDFVDAMRQRIMAYEMAESVAMLGQLDSIEDYFHLSDLFVLPSRLEGLPNVFLEAMACKLPVIGSDILPITELIENEVSGIIIHQDDSDALAQAIIDLLNNPAHALVLAENGLHMIEEQFELGIVVKRYEQLYDSFEA
jgi:glycosyltransferase involved in cell wall biosynthesis